MWMYISGALFLLLLASIFTKGRGAASSEESASTNPEAR
jgi:hypothetical protein